jgi:hypothetical protein
MTRLLTLRNAGPNADTAGDLYTDAIRMLQDACALTHKPTGVKPKDASEIREILTGVLDILTRQLESTGERLEIPKAAPEEPAKGSSRDPESNEALLEDAITQLETALLPTADWRTHVDSALVMLKDVDLEDDE